jgi:hypothetical protein
MATSVPKRNVWSQLSPNGRVLSALGWGIGLAVGVSGAFIWREHIAGDLYYVGIALVLAGGALIWLTTIAAAKLATRGGA